MYSEKIDPIIIFYIDGPIKMDLVRLEDSFCIDFLDIC